MPRIDYIDEGISDEARALIESADCSGLLTHDVYEFMLKIKMLASNGLNIGTVCFMGACFSCPKGIM